MILTIIMIFKSELKEKGKEKKKIKWKILGLFGQVLYL